MERERMKMIGLVNEIIDDTCVSFYFDKNIECDIDDVIALIQGERVIVARLVKIEVNYYLNDIKQYFISKAADNKLSSLVEPQAQPRYGYIGLAEIMGIYTLKDGYLEENKLTINKFSPRIFQPVYLLDKKLLPALFGLSADQGIELGTVIKNSVVFPAKIENKILKKHTLITGVTGSGKSRLVFNILSQIADKNVHISVLDPHDEYISFLDRNTSRDVKIYKFCRLYKNNLEVKSESRIIYRTLAFPETYLDASSLVRLLPHVSVQQEECLFEVFDEIKKNTLIEIINKLVEWQKKEIDKDDPEFWNRVKEVYDKIKTAAKSRSELIEYSTILIRSSYKEKNNSGRMTVYNALILKLIELYKKKIVVNYTPNWLENASPNTIDIFNIDYSSNEYIRRFINTVLQCFITHTFADEIRILVIDEAHLLLKEETETKKILIRLLREARKFNTTLIFLTQNENDLPEEMLSQIQNKFTFRNVNDQHLKYLQDQICICKLYGSKMAFPLRVKDIY